MSSTISRTISPTSNVRLGEPKRTLENCDTLRNTPRSRQCYIRHIFWYNAVRCGGTISDYFSVNTGVRQYVRGVFLLQHYSTLVWTLKDFGKLGLSSAVRKSRSLVLTLRTTRRYSHRRSSSIGGNRVAERGSRAAETSSFLDQGQGPGVP